jgi:hypothetical protein
MSPINGKWDKQLVGDGDMVRMHASFFKFL